VRALSPRLGINWRPLSDPGLHVKANAGTSFRAPTFNDRFWRYAEAGAPGGDPDLRPERGWSADMGLGFQLGRLRAEATAYGSWLRDQIVWHPAGGGYYAPLNLGRTRTLGLEMSAEVRPIVLGSWTLGGGGIYGLTDARDRSDPTASSFDQALRYVPRHQLKSHLSLARPLGDRASLRLDADSRYVAPRPVRSDGSLAEPAYHVADVRLRGVYRSESFTTSLSFELENVFDADYAVLRGYPMPPRHGRLRLQLSF
jgi:vitamin B12 transporter